MFRYAVEDTIEFGDTPRSECEATVKETFTKAAGEKLWQIVEPTSATF